MDTNEKREFTYISKLDSFEKIMKKLVTNEELTFEEKSYLLTCSLLFIEHYNLDKRKKSYLEFAYYIILKYSIHYKDYIPLYNFSINFGFYPISKFILDKKLLKNIKIEDILIDEKLNNFYNGEYTETLEQYKIKKDFLEDNSKELSYIAPTSYGKSSIIIEYLSKIDDLGIKKIGIIVPSKSLLIQTYKSIKKSGLNSKILLHDEMYSGEKSFIAIFTQERALRLLNKEKNLYFDVLFIDEAHNLFEKDSRSVLLSRLIRRSIKLNPDIKIIYLSPLISDVNNLKVNNEQIINTHRINFNIKEPEIYEFNSNNEIYKYNRFFIGDGFKGYKIGVGIDYLSYITDKSSNKNFIYHKTPRKIQEISGELSKILSIKNVNITLSKELIELIETLKNEVHKDFYIVDYLQNGVIYLHGKIPDLIKEYLEFKFKELKDIKYVIANTVILEGINLPIDSLFIMNTHGLQGNNLINLVGRVNRLNNVFSEENSDLTKLLPNIHFVYSEFEDTRCKQFNTIKYLKSNIFADKVKNPTLNEFDIEKIRDINSKSKMLQIQNNEKFLEEDSLVDEVHILKKYLIETGINDFYIDEFFDKVVVIILEKINSKKTRNWHELRLLDKISNIFIDNLSENIESGNISYLKDFEIKRLGNKSARDYYEYFIEINLKRSLNDNITGVYDYFKEKSISNIETERKFYFGQSYGEVVYDSINYPYAPNKVYVDMKGKSDKELINLSVVKIKLEENFISFKLNKLISFLYDFELITEEDYYNYIYGTNDKSIVKFINSGLTPSLTKRLKNDEQLKNIKVDSYNNLVGNDNFEEYKKKISNFYKFELEKFIN